MVTSAIFAIAVLNALAMSLPQLFLITGVLNIAFGLFLYLKLNKHIHHAVIQTHDSADNSNDDASFSQSRDD